MSRRAERTLAALLLLAGAAPLFAGRFLPFLDMPQHLGLANALARYGDPSTGFARYYELDRAVDPYWGYYALVWVLSHAVPLELASKLVLAAWAISLPLSVGFALRCLGRDWRWAVFALPLVWHENLFFGFTTFLVSMPLFFVAVGLFARELSAERSRRGRAALLGVVAAAVFLSHVQTYLLLGLAAVALALVEGRGPRLALARARAFLPSLALFLAWFLPNFAGAGHPVPLAHTACYRSFGSLGDLGAVFEPKAETLARAPERIWGMYADGSGLALGAGYLLLLALSAALAGWPDSDTAAEGLVPGREGGFRAALRARRGELLAVLSLACYLLLPAQVAGQWYLNARFLIFAALLAPAFLAARARGGRRLLLAGAAALALVSDANAARKVAAFQREVEGFASLVERMSPGGRALGLVFDRASAAGIRLPVFVHFASYYQALRGGDVGFSFVGLPSIPLRYRAGAQAPHPGEWAPQDFRWESMGPRYDYFLLRGVPVGDAARLAEHAERVGEGGGFTLYRRRDVSRGEASSP